MQVILSYGEYSGIWYLNYSDKGMLSPENLAKYRSKSEALAAVLPGYKLILPKWMR